MANYSSISSLVEVAKPKFIGICSLTDPNLYSTLIKSKFTKANRICNSNLISCAKIYSSSYTFRPKMNVNISLSIGSKIVSKANYEVGNRVGFSNCIYDSNIIISKAFCRPGIRSANVYLNGSNSLRSFVSTALRAYSAIHSIHLARITAFSRKKANIGTINAYQLTIAQSISRSDKPCVVAEVSATTNSKIKAISYRKIDCFSNGLKLISTTKLKIKVKHITEQKEVIIKSHTPKGWKRRR